MNNIWCSRFSRQTLCSLLLTEKGLPSYLVANAVKEAKRNTKMFFPWSYREYSMWCNNRWWNICNGNIFIIKKPAGFSYTSLRRFRFSYSIALTNLKAVCCTPSSSVRYDFFFNSNRAWRSAHHERVIATNFEVRLLSKNCLYCRRSIYDLAPENVLPQQSTTRPPKKVNLQMFFLLTTCFPASCKATP